MRKLAVVAFTLLLAMIGFTGAAGAHPSNGGLIGTTFLDGAGTLTDDWGDNFAELGNSLCNGCPDSWNTDLVVVWQAILAAEGFLTPAQIDGQFGPITANATRSWQTRYNIGVDGLVGNQTWSAADNRLSSAGNLVLYRSSVTSGDVGFYRGNENIGIDDGAYELVDSFVSIGQYYTFGNTRVQFFSKTVTGPTASSAPAGRTADR